MKLSKQLWLCAVMMAGIIPVLAMLNQWATGFIASIGFTLTAMAAMIMQSSEKTKEVKN